jgi:CRP/FNR family cyclic AMP-dependent transcriptional regulator
MLRRQRLKEINLLKKVPLFSNLNKRQLNEISKHANLLQVNDGYVMAKQGEKGGEFFFIVEGKAQVKKGSKIIRNLKSGDYFGEISLIDGKPRTASVIAENDVTILVFHKRSFDHLLKTVTGLRKNILVSLCIYLRRAEIYDPPLDRMFLLYPEVMKIKFGIKNATQRS